MATGHYIQRRDGPAGPELRRAVDAERDQSYFLFATTRGQLERLWFPLGGMRKADVRSLARTLELPIAEKPDSQDICFVPTGSYASVIERLKPGALRPGDIVHIDGRRLGRHDGIVNFTIGQRRGLRIAVGEPLFVVRLDADRNEVIVGPRDFLRTTGLLVRNVNWLGDEPLGIAAAEGMGVYARLRSTGAPRLATVFADGPGNVRVVLAQGEEGVAAGQACVFYDDDKSDARVLGGGWITETSRHGAT